MSEPLYAPRLRPERLIAAARVVLAAASLFAVWLDPQEPIRYAAAAYGVLIGYVVYAGAVAAILWRVGRVPRLWPIVTHAVDLVCFSLFIFFTDPASPFTVYFVFALLAATLRWQVRGTFWTAVVVIAAFFAFGFYFGVVLRGTEFDLRAFIIRGVYLVVLAGLLAYVGTQDQRTVREMSRLAAWPHAMRADAESLARDLLGYSATLLDAPRAVLVWAEPETPWHRLAVWNQGAWRHERHPIEAAIVDAALRDRAFISTAERHKRTLVQEPGRLELTTWPGEPLDPAFASRLHAAAVVSVPLRGESFEGRLLFLDKVDSTLDDLVLAEIVGGVVTARLDAFYLTEQLRQAAATEERIRLARDLHDGVLQSFTGIALRLAAIRRMVNGDRSEGVAALEDVQRVLASEQRDLRFFIQELKPTRAPAGDAALDARLEELAQRMEREWDLRVELRLEVDGSALTAPLRREVYHIVREALVNAARHGAASTAHVVVAPSGADAIAVVIDDNGRGFAFSGRYSAEELAQLDLGPKTLRERVRAARGSLVLESGPGGVQLNVILPVSEAA